MHVADREIFGVWNRSDTGVRYEFNKIRVIIGEGEDAEVSDYSVRPGARSHLLLNGNAFEIISMSRFRFVIDAGYRTVEFLRTKPED
jgi:predicted carbohydrate-binding protein with CBM5 and CBM33 domain